MSAPDNAALIRRNYERFEAGDGGAVYATWSPEAVWHVLDATRYQGDYSRDEYFGMLAGWAGDVPDYAYEILSCKPYGDDLVVVHLRSTGTTPDGPVDSRGGLMIYRVVDGQIVEGWAVSRGRDATTAF